MSRSFKFKEVLEQVTNVAVLGVALIVGTILIRNSMGGSQATSAPVTKPEMGQQLDEMSGHEWAKHKGTLLLVLSTRCQHCRDSVPFYRKVVGLGRTSRLDAGLVAVFAEPSNVAKEFLDAAQLEVPFVASADFNGLRVSGTPTVILVDSTGRVARAWTGRLSQEGESSLLEAVSTTTRIGW